MANQWKAHERKVAKMLGVKRRSRGANFGESAGDLEPHKVFSVECKYRRKLSGFLVQGLEQAKRYDPSKTPILVLKEKHMHGELVVMHMKDFVAHMGKI